MLSRCYGYYLVYTEYSSICLATIWCTQNASNSEMFCPRRLCRNHSSAQDNCPKTDHHCATLFQVRGCNIKKSCQGINKQNTQASCSRAAMATIWCTLNALIFAWLLSGPHWMLEAPRLLSVKTIVQTIQQRIAIHPTRIITVLPLFKPADAK